MRRVLISDLLAAASVIGAAPDPLRTAQTLIMQADAAHRYAKRFGRPHPAWGNGSLLARARAAPQGLPTNLANPDFLTAMAQLATTLAAAKSRCPPR